MKTKYVIVTLLAALLAPLFCLSCGVKSIPEKQTLQLADIYQDAENSKPWFKVADGDYALLANTRDLTAAITVRFEMTGDAKVQSTAAAEADVRKQASLGANAELTKDFSNKNYYLIPVDAFGNVITVTGTEDGKGYFKGDAEQIYNFVNYADVGTVRPFPFKITVKDRKSLAAIMDAASFRIAEEGAVSYPVAGGGAAGPQQKVYTVGTDLKPGEYVIEPGNADITVRIQGESTQQWGYRNPTYIILKQGETLAITGTAKVTPSADVSLKPVSLDDIPGRMYKVGKDIPAGRYALKGTSGAIALFTVGDLRGESIASQRPDKTAGENSINVMGTSHPNGDFYYYTIEYRLFAGWNENGISSVYRDTAKYIDGKTIWGFKNSYLQDGYTQAEYEKALAYAKSKSYIEAQNGQYLLVARDSRAQRVK